MIKNREIYGIQKDINLKADKVYTDQGLSNKADKTSVFTKAEIDKKLEDLNIDRVSKNKYEVPTSSFVLNEATGIYEYTLTHNLNTAIENIDIAFYKDSESAMLDYRYVDANSILVQSNEAVDLAIVLRCSTGTGAYVSSDIHYTKSEADQKFSLVNSSFNEAKTDYWGKEHESLKDRLDTDFQFVSIDNSRGMYLNQEFNKTKNVTNTIDGKAKDCEISGLTLQNLCVKTLSNTTKGSDGYFTSKIPTYDYLFRDDDSDLIPDHAYTIIIEMKENTLNVPFSFRGTNFWEKSEYPFSPGETGIKAFISKTKVSFEGNHPYIAWFAAGNPETTTGHFRMRYMVLKGNHLNNIPQYFEGISSVGLCDDNIVYLKSKNKNLWNGTIERGNIAGHGSPVSGTNIYNDSGEFVRSQIGIELNVGSSYRYSICEPNIYRVEKCGLLDNNKGEFSTWLLEKNNILTPTNSHRFLKFTIVKKDGTPLSDEDIKNIRFQVEENTVVTDYSQNATSSISLSLPIDDGLRKIGNGCDVWKPEQGIVIRNTDKYVFDGTGYIGHYNTPVDGLDEYVSFLISASIYPHRKPSIGDMCNHLPCRYSTSFIGEFIEPHPSIDNWTMIRVKKSRLTTPDSNGLREWLSRLYSEENPLTLYFETKEPTVYEVPKQKISTFNEATYFIQENTICGSVKLSVPATVSGFIKDLLEEDEVLKKEILGVEEGTKFAVSELNEKNLDITFNMLEMDLRLLDIEMATLELNNKIKIIDEKTATFKKLSKKSKKSK